MNIEQLTKEIFVNFFGQKYCVAVSMRKKTTDNKLLINVTIA